MEIYRTACPKCNKDYCNCDLEFKINVNQSCHVCKGDKFIYIIDGQQVTKEEYRKIYNYDLIGKDDDIYLNENRCKVCGIGLDPDFENKYDGCCYECYDPGT